MDGFPQNFNEPYQCHLSDGMQKLAERELGERVEDRQCQIEELRVWLHSKSHIICRTDDRFLLAFLRSCKFQPERTKEKLERFMRLKTLHPEIMGGGDPLEPCIQLVLKSGIFVPMPKRLPNGQRLVIARHRDPELLSLQDTVRGCGMLTMLMMELCEAAQIAGIVVLFDQKGTSGAHLGQFGFGRIAYDCLTSSPILFKGLHLLNSNTLVQWVWPVIKPMLSDKFRNRVWFHGKSLKSLHAYIPTDCLPSEYGGSLGSIGDIIVEWHGKVEQHRSYFLDHMRYGVKEK